MKQINHTLFITFFLMFLLLATSAHAVGPFVDNGDGTVSDEVTGLMWQQTDDGVTRTWEDACQACEELELAGYNDWRVPSVEELKSIVDYSKYDPSISDGIFNNVKSSYYWSGSTYADGTDGAWRVVFGYGGVGNYGKTIGSFVRCVRSGSYWSFDPLDYLVIKNDNIVEDTQKELEWQREDDGVERTWEVACQYCEDLVLDGHSDWRIPDVEELSSIVDYTRYNPSIPANIFNNVKTINYWSGSTRASNTDFAWLVHFYHGNVGYASKPYDKYVRCVRSGSSGSFDPLTFSILASEEEGYAPLVVSFSCTVSSGSSPYEYEWDFGDGSAASSQQNPVHTYDVSGVYAVICKVTDSAGEELSKSVAVEVLEREELAVTLQVSPSSGKTGQEFSFSCTAVSGNPPYTYLWDFGDDSAASSQQNPSHIFDVADYYSVLCTVNDTTGQRCTETILIDVQQSQELVIAPLEATLTSGVAPLLTTFFCEVTSGNPPYTYSWNFGDGTQAVSQESPEHTFHSPGTFTVRCTVTDAVGQTASGTIAIETSEKTSKAIIIAGGGPYEENAIWEDTVTCVQIAYRALRNQGYEEENIYFISPDNGIDIDGDGDLDVDAYATLDEVYNAVTYWSVFSNPPDELLIYMTDHGGVGKFMLNEDQEWLYARDLDLWLDTIQRNMDVDVILVYDACYSGSFIQYMTPPPGKLRILITSSGPDEAASFADDTLYSFSYQFWAKIIQSGSLYNGFTSGTTQMCGRQTPQIEANWILQDGSNIVPNEKEDKSIASTVRLGKGYGLAAVPPVIGEMPDTMTLDGSESARLWAGSIITASGGLDRVWAMVIPPDAYSGSADVPVTGLPVVELLDGDSDGVYDALYDGFGKTGTYEVNFFAMYTVMSGDLEVEVISDPVMTTVIQTGSGTLNIDTPDKYVTMTNDGAVCRVPSGYVYHVYGCQGTNSVVIESGAGA
ncbi:DUF1566 domain-containing protein, partial [Desulfamplus magnetovallimortis]|uniref:Lcl domain-containing protein n=1 Tax=Desulfamplus magnetovallimortis TaxID=1246637 RepID=UPI00111AA6E4